MPMPTLTQPNIRILASVVSSIAVFAITNRVDIATLMVPFVYAMDFASRNYPANVALRQGIAIGGGLATFLATSNPVLAAAVPITAYAVDAVHQNRNEIADAMGLRARQPR